MSAGANEKIALRAVWSIADTIVSPLGYTTAENYTLLRQGVSGVSLQEAGMWWDEAVYAAAVKSLPAANGQSRFERMSLLALRQTLADKALPSEKTIFILSTTKGNIDQLGQELPRLPLHETATYLAHAVGLQHSLVVSNACISGVLALIVAKRYLETGAYDHAVVLGADVLSRFVVSGFRSLHALSAGPCRPFDAHRTGINLGEAAAVMVLTTDPRLATGERVRLRGAGVSNDANHISGPSRTGQELAQAIGQALQASTLTPGDIDAVYAHGTATVYNDEMEAKAFDLAGLAAMPVNSLKGYYGHTLGAAGVLETIVAAQSLHHGEMLPTFGFATLGVSRPLQVSATLKPLSGKRILKTASGFGGCNAALVLEKETNPS
ncbi:beta-ketoacyl synthase [Fulvivirgaceae bacterium PWU5]|uniref:Beta-ketoacyl synthase n=1 Tax=Dawidia cretensis TaxID=2782350 RepID=A0AAP2E3W7_9BACT|nr:beta-ketoacyl synthase N-terminal-like domain-containing protein [Dawidia cretensis]MBT1711109.1 beta-ketoacyl synthase [Dawidia cretensis]